MTTATYEELCEDARRRSVGHGRYAAVVEIVTYMQERSRTTVMVASGPIRARSQGGCFVAVLCHFRDGKPYGPVRPTPLTVPIPVDDDELPF